jgi:hypothetical protein
MDRVAEDMDDYRAERDGTDRGMGGLLEFLSTLNYPLSKPTGKPLINFAPSKPKGESSKFPER